MLGRGFFCIRVVIKVKGDFALNRKYDRVVKNKSETQIYRNVTIMIDSNVRQKILLDD